MEIYERLNKAIDYLRYKGVSVTHEEVANKLKRHRVNVTKALNGNMKYLTRPFLKDFAEAYGEYINEGWLLTGEGEMAVPDKETRPHFDAKASAGFMDGESVPEMSAEMRSMIVDLPLYDFTIQVNGESMLPEINPGDILACKRCTDAANPPIGKMCVLDLRDGPVVKILSGSGGGHVTLHSLNPAYPDYTVPAADVLGVATVIGLIRVM